MALTQDITIRKGDTRKLVVPVLDGDSADNQFLGGLDAVSVEFALANDFGGEVLLNTSDVTTQIEAFGDLKLGTGAFAEIDTIADTQNVVTVTIPASKTETLAQTPEDGELAYQVRLTETTDGNEERLTPVVGAVTVDGAAINGGGV